MVATANVKLYPDAYRKLKRIAKHRRWTLAVTVDEALKCFEQQHRQTPEESTGSPRAEMKAVAAATNPSESDLAGPNALSESPSPTASAAHSDGAGFTTNHGTVAVSQAPANESPGSQQSSSVKSGSGNRATDRNASPERERA